MKERKQVTYRRENFPMEIPPGRVGEEGVIYDSELRDLSSRTRR
jgi:hypothetical protein